MPNFPAFPLDPSGTGGYGRLAPGTTRECAPRVLRNNFGGGYEQRAGDGINTLKRTVTARWENLDGAQRRTIDNFLKSRRGYLPFTHPYPSDDGEGAEVVQWECASWSHSWVDGTLSTITATLVENFDP